MISAQTRNIPSRLRSRATRSRHRMPLIVNSSLDIGLASRVKDCWCNWSIAFTVFRASRLASRHDLPLPPLSAVAERVTFPFEIWRLVDVRWKELGYRSLSAYITGLIRYDLLVSGPHSSITADCRSKLQRKLTRKTLADRRKGRRRKILLDHLIEEAEGRPIPEQELERVKARIVKELRRISFSPGSAKMPAHTISFQREPIRTSSRGASTVKVERSAASNTFTAHSER